MTAEVAGWIGFVVVIAGYAASIVRSDPAVFHAANAAGSLGIAASAFASRAWPNLALTAVFGAIGTAAFFAGVVRGDAEPTGEA